MNNNNNQITRQMSIVDDGPLRIHVGNIPFSWSDKHLREQFEVNSNLLLLKKIFGLDFRSC